MQSSFSHQQSVLRELGLQLSEPEASKAYSILSSLPEFEKIKQSLQAQQNTKTNENLFIDKIMKSHRQFDKSPSIYQDKNTFIIRAIDPEKIVSLTDRAFFNSFNLQRNTKNNKKQRTEQKNEEEEKCICGKQIPNSEWVQCINEGKCRGSNWYHLECAGFEQKDIEKLKDKQYTCQPCKRQVDESQNQLRKKRKPEIS